MAGASAPSPCSEFSASAWAKSPSVRCRGHLQPGVGIAAVIAMFGHRLRPLFALGVVLILGGPARHGWRYSSRA
jgi:hypothetical protein